MAGPVLNEIVITHEKGPPAMSLCDRPTCEAERAYEVYGKSFLIYNASVSWCLSAVHEFLFTRGV